MKPVYMDNNATTRVADEVYEAMQPYFTEHYGNASSMYSFAAEAGKAIKKAREQVAALLNCSPDEILFTSCGTESDNTAVKSVMEAHPSKHHIITSRVEHPAIRTTCRHMKQRFGCSLTELPVDGQGMINLDELRSNLRDDTGLVTIMHANNETGVIFPIEQITNMVKERGAIMHTDAVQTVGKLPLDMKKLPVDMLSISGHKLHAPKGVGALFVRRGVKLPPMIHGGHQEGGKRGGTENVPYIVGLGVACEEAMKYMDDENTRVKKLRDKLQEGLMTNSQDAYLNGHPDLRLPNTANISFEYVEGEAILLLLDAHAICASSGSACTSGSLEPSHVLRAMGVPFTRAHGSIRFSLSRYTTEEEVDFVIEKIPPIIERLRSMSPFGRSQKAMSS
ncbi:MAG: cysteine desulfurase NifS [Candidatus Sumerlaeia bacterium]